jgi:hypothetical protein
VVATDFGGTRDFISEQTGYPVSYTLVALTQQDYPGATGSHWAEPSIEHAAHIFGELYANPGRAAERSLAGYKHLQLHNSLLKPLAAKSGRPFTCPNGTWQEGCSQGITTAS